MKRREFLRNTATALGVVTMATATGQAETSKPNILWIVTEDASPHIGCYGETAIETPNIDALAAEGVRFENAFVSCPVCSPARSAMVTGMYQTTIGSHNHRSQHEGSKAGGNTAYYESYALPKATPMIGDYFREAGYYVCNGKDPASNKPGKTDYNFINTSPPYDGADWRNAPDGKPFFSQIQLAGGKWRKAAIDHDNFTLPPYYPDDPVIRKDWAEYLASWKHADQQVGKIIGGLKAAGVYDNTLVIFMTDHGISHARGKQFLYDEGIRIPLIVRFPDGREAGTTRTDLALHIDMAPISMGFAGLPIPPHLQGQDLFAANHRERDFVVSARDRCDESIDTIRSVRTAKFKYIRNFQSARPHLQRSQYKDAKPILQRLRMLHALEALSPLQESLFTPSRAPEELYDLVADPHETTNLAGDPAHEATLQEQRKRLYRWMVDTRDPGLIPEPILEDLGRKHGSKYAAMQRPEMADRIPAYIRVIEAGESNDRTQLKAALTDTDPVARYWAATWIGNLRALECRDGLKTAATDAEPTVQVAAHLALCKIGEADTSLSALIRLIDEPNVLVGLYAMNAVEQTGILNPTVAAGAEKALANVYDGTQRYGRRLKKKCEELFQ